MRPAPDQWARVEVLFKGAVELPPGEREAFLLQSCPTDHDVRRAVERLIAAHESAGDFLTSMPPALASGLLAGNAHADADAVPDRVGPYRIVRRVGGGGMGVVYLGFDPRLERPVALKLLHAEWSQAVRARLVEEARIASALDHPGIAPVYEIGESAQGRTFIAMTYCEGEPLSALVARGPLAFRRVAHIARQVADALAAAHRQGIVHRDVKPGNIMVGADDRARLVDFGIAHMTGRDAASAGPHAGTPAYMSPEQTRGGGVDAHSDVWSLGVVMYEMLTGQRPFRGDGDEALVRAIRAAALPPIRGLAPDVPAQFAALIERCLNEQPALRPGAAHLADELAAWSEGTARHGARRPRSAVVTRARKVAAAAGALVLVATTAALMARRSGDGDAAPAGALAVLPFTPVDADSALARMGRELVVLLSSGLDGGGGLFVVEPIAVLARSGDVDGTLAAYEDAAARLGADRVVAGRLTRTGERVRADAAVFDRAGMGVLARASAHGPAHDVAALSDGLTLQLLRAIGAPDGVTPARRAALTTSSIPALRAYLEGEVAIAHANFRAAADAFARAIAADSSFWLAYWRHLYARSYHSDPVDSSIVAAVVRNRAALPEPDRLLVEARMERSVRASLALRRSITEQFPSYWPAWFDLADQLMHHGAFIGHSLDEARTALRRTADLNPSFLPAWEHLMWASVLVRDSATTRIALERLRLMARDSARHQAWELRPLDYYAYLDHLTRSAGAPDSGHAEIGADVIAGFRGAGVPERLAVTLTNYGFHSAQLDLSARVAARHPPAGTSAAHEWGRALAHAGRGDWGEAIASAARYARTSTDPAAPLRAYGLAVVGAWLGRLPPAAPEPLRLLATRSPVGSTSAGSAEVAWLDGMLACTQRDTARLARLREGLRSSEAGAAAALQRSLAAFAAALAGRRTAAGDSLAALEWAIADSSWAWRYGADHPFMIAVNRIAAARWLLAAGDTTQALRLLRLHETDLPGTLHPLPAANMVIGGLALPAVSDVEDAAGLPTLAGRHRAWHGEDPMPTAAVPRILDGAIVCGAADP